jgi:hypothetical protein
MICLKADSLSPDPVHGRRLPSGRLLSGILRSFFARQEPDVRRQFMAGVERIRLSQWTIPMAEACTEPLEAYFDRGIEDTRRVLRRQARGLPNLIGKIETGYVAAHQEVLAAARTAALVFCRETNDTAATQLNVALDQLREGLAQGLELGEAQIQLTGRVQALFRDPYRAHTIAATESSRAVHAGELLIAQNSEGLVRATKWLASSDACKKCLALNDKEVNLGVPFHVDPGGSPYGYVYHPPLHPR